MKCLRDTLNTHFVQIPNGQMLKGNIQPEPRVRADYDHHRMKVWSVLVCFPSKQDLRQRVHAKYAIALGPPPGIAVKGRAMRQGRRGINFLLLCYTLPQTQWLKTTNTTVSHSFCESGIQGRLSQVVLAQDLSELSSRHQLGLQDFRAHPRVCCQETSVPGHGGGSVGLLMCHGSQLPPESAM